MELHQPEIPGLAVKDEVPAFALPKKPTCTPAEAGRALGISERQIRYLIEDGTLLAISSNRDPEQAERPQWRVVVRMERPAPTGRVGRTLEEEFTRRSNQ
jgi:hypothetical protein